MTNYSKGVKALIDDFRERYADSAFTDEEAKTIFGGKATKVADMSDVQILQFMVLDQQTTIAALLAEKSKTVTPNREQRRKAARAK